ncbi:MAG: helix-turn-helix domain-containing protein [Ktedonobacterales bacterium]
MAMRVHRLAMTKEQRAEVEAAQRQSRNVRHWKRYQAVLLRADGMPVAVVAQTLGCTQTSVSNWTTAWRSGGVARVHEGVHRGADRRLDVAGEQHLEALLRTDPQALGHAATGWTVALLQTELATGGWQAGERTIRRTLHRLGWVWKRPRFVLGRPDPEYQTKKGAWQHRPAR